MSIRTVTSISWSKVDDLMREAVIDPATADNKKHPAAAFPGAVLLVGSGDDIVYHQAFGSRSIVPQPSRMDESIVFDVASLTKAVVTTALCMYLQERGMLEVDRKLSHIFQTFSVHGKERISVRNLLSHSSGYPAYVPFYKRIAKADSGDRIGFMGTRDAAASVYSEIFRLRLDHLPGKVACYSDVGFILLGSVVETLSGMALDRLAVREIFKPLSMQSTGFIDLSAVKRRVLVPENEAIAPTNNCPWRRRMICGEVQDENAWAMGGVAGHAGLFSTARDLHAFASEMIRCFHGEGKLFSKETVRSYWTKDTETPNSTWTLGWDTPTPGASQSGKYFSPLAVGHLGYTGCSLWIDPERRLSVILLSNRVHPSAENNLIKQFRPLVHDAVMETLGFV
jgi:CubicO group peptidase (beta-lactamase class C family)